jgi:tRNA(His) 5'-end guanylyltransferase
MNSENNIDQQPNFINNTTNPEVKFRVNVTYNIKCDTIGILTSSQSHPNYDESENLKAKERFLSYVIKPEELIEELNQKYMEECTKLEIVPVYEPDSSTTKILEKKNNTQKEEVETNQKFKSTKREKYEKIGNKMKQYESVFGDLVLDSTKPFIVRIDGHCFSGFMSCFISPFDQHFQDAMIETTKDIINEYHGITGYTQSDEISILFPPIIIEKEEDKPKTLIFGGRILKITSVISSYGSVRFNYHLLNYIEKWKSEEKYDKIKEKILSGKAHFDGRTFNVEMNDVVDAFKWRSLDCIRNSKTRFAQAEYIKAQLPKKQLYGLSANDTIKLCKEKCGKDWHDCTDQSKYGVFVKKQLIKKKVFDKKKNKEIEVERGDTVSLCYDLETSKDSLTFLMSKYYK